MRVISKHDCSPIFPTKLLNEEWAINVHLQTLNQLDNRGGLTVREILINVFRLKLSDTIIDDSLKQIELMELIIKVFSR